MLARQVTQHWAGKEAGYVAAFNDSEVQRSLAQAALKRMPQPCSDRAPTNTEKVGMVWWNNLTDDGRAAALRAANTAVPAEAYEYWARTGGQPNSRV